MAPPTSAARAAAWPLVVGTISSAEFLAQHAATAPEARVADLVEARLDLFEGRDGPGAVDAWLNACARLQATGTPVVVTLRLAGEGGRWSGRDEDRLPLLERAIRVVSWIDVEAASPLAAEVVRRAHAAGRRVVLSHHDFQMTPALEDLRRIVADARAAGADVAKVAVMVNGPEDRDRVFQLLDERADDRLCVIGMGADAASLRVSLAAAGSIFAYAYLDRPAAPGQLSVAELADRLRAASPGYRAHHDRRTAGAPPATDLI
jgi:3-dehydroquinate dehydratase-1